MLELGPANWPIIGLYVNLASGEWGDLSAAGLIDLEGTEPGAGVHGRGS